MTGHKEQPGDDFPDWEKEIDVDHPPGTIEPTPAQEVADLRGRRIIIGVPGLGWRSDLRADSSIIQGSRTYVPTLPEQEWYRAESEQTEVFAPLVPIERVWVEVVEPFRGHASERDDLISRLVSLDKPPRHFPTPIQNTSNVTGRRVVQIGAADGRPIVDRRDLRAVTEPYTSINGDICVRICIELDWYKWAWSGRPPKTLPVPIHLLWIE